MGLFYKTSNHRTLQKIHLVREFNRILQKTYSTKRQTIVLYEKSIWCAYSTEFYKKLILQNVKPSNSTKNLLGARIQRNSTKNLFYKTSNHRTLQKIHLVREFNGILQKTYSTKRQ